MQPEENTGNLTVYHSERGDLIEKIGRFNPITIAYDVLTGTTRSIWQQPSAEMADRINEMYKDVEWNGNYEIMLGHNNLLRQLRRLYSPERRENLLIRSVLGLPLTISSGTIGKLMRSNHYNPFTETAVVYKSNIAVAAHELGHAEDMGESDSPAFRYYLYSLPGFKEATEWKASRNAMRHLENNDERKKAYRVLAPAFGTYFAASTVGAAGILAHFAPQISASFMDMLAAIEEIPVFGAFALTAAGALGAGAAARINNLFRKNGDNLFYKPSLEEP